MVSLRALKKKKKTTTLLFQENFFYVLHYLFSLVLTVILISLDLELERKGPIRRIFHTHNLAQTTFLASFLPAKDCSLCGI